MSTIPKDEVTAIDILEMHSGLLPATIKQKYSWVISAMNEYASRRVLEYQQSEPIDETIYKQSCIIVDLKKAINESLPAAAELMQQISDSKDKQIEELKAENERLKAQNENMVRRLNHNL